LPSSVEEKPSIWTVQFSPANARSVEIPWTGPIANVSGMNIPLG
jgi:hypothetical protein